MNKEYVFRKEVDSDVYILNTARKEEVFIFELTGDILISANMDAELEERIFEILDTLTEPEKQAVMYYCNYSTEIKTVTELSEKLGCSSARVSQIKDKAFRKMRHPTRSKILLGKVRNLPTYRAIYPKDEKYKYHSSQWDIFHEMDGTFKDILIREIRSKFLKKERTQLGLLDKIITTSMISVDSEGGYLGDSIDELELSVRAYNSLRRAGVSTVQDLLYVIDSLDTIKGLGAETQKEIMSLVINSDYKKISPVVVYRNNKGYKVTESWKNEEEKAETIYELLKKHGEPFGIITEEAISWGLMSLLLMKGYLFIDMILEEYSKIAKELLAGGFAEYANELYRFVEMMKPYAIIPELNRVKVLKVDSKIAHMIIKKKPVDFAQLLECCDIGDEDIDAKYKLIFREAFAGNENFGIAENAC